MEQTPTKEQTPNQRNLAYLLGQGTFQPATTLIGQHLLDHGKITKEQAQKFYRSGSLSRRICDLTDAGVMVCKKTRRDALGQRYVTYGVA